MTQSCLFRPALTDLDQQGYSFWQYCEDYINCKNNAQKVSNILLENGDRKKISIMKEAPLEEYAFWKTFLKITSYIIFFFLPLAALAYCAYKRNQFDFETVSEEKPSIVSIKEKTPLIDAPPATTIDSKKEHPVPKEKDNTPVSVKSVTLKVISSPKPSFTNVNKEYIYDEFANGKIVDDNIAAHYYTPDKEWMSKQPVFRNKPLLIEERQQNFCFDPSTKSTEHWTADFADNTLFGFCEGGLLAQEELLCAEHPGLVHFYNAIKTQPEFRYLQGFNKPEEEYRIALVEGAKRRGEVRMYGSEFSKTPKDQIKKHLTRFENPQESLIFAIAAPAPNLDLIDQPYQKQDIEGFIYRAFNAFYHANKHSGERNKKAHIHTGNWGCGAFGGNPILAAVAQLAAAESAGIAKVIYHPRSSKADFETAKNILQEIRTQQPKITLGDLVDFLAQHAQNYSLFYRMPNGT